MCSPMAASARVPDFSWVAGAVVEHLLQLHQYFGAPGVVGFVEGGEIQIVELLRGIGRINTLSSLFHQEKKGIHDAAQP